MSAPETDSPAAVGTPGGGPPGGGSSGGSLAPDDPRVEAARELVAAQFEHYSSYHAHKESMAYAGLAIYAAAAGTVLSGEWPPKEWKQNDCVAGVVACVLLTLLWGVVLAYLHFALSRRRWGALRMAGCEMAMVWLATRRRIDPAELDPVEYGDVQVEVEAEVPPATPSRVAGLLRRVARVIHWLGQLLAYPLTDKLEAVKDQKGVEVYPQFLMRAWKKQELVGTGAVRHERLIFAAGWGVYLATLVRTAAGAGWI